MNTRDRKSENWPEVAKQTQPSKHAFDWPDEPQDSAPPVDVNVKWIRGEHLLNWGLFWLVTWLGTTVAGALFGGVLGLSGAANAPMAPLWSLLFGVMWAGGVGLFLFVHLAVICWTFCCLGRPLVVAITAGALTGAICGMIIFSLVTAPLGAVGAYLAGKMFLNSTTGANFLATIEAVQNQSLGPLRFTMRDLLLRVTVLAAFLAGWTAWLQS